MSMFIGEALVGEGNEIAHIDLLIGSKDGPVGVAFANALARQSEGHSNLLAVLTPNLAVKPATVMITKVTIKGAKQAVQMFGPAQAAVAKGLQLQGHGRRDLQRDEGQADRRRDDRRQGQGRPSVPGLLTHERRRPETAAAAAPLASKGGPCRTASFSSSTVIRSLRRSTPSSPSMPASTFSCGTGA